MKIFSSQTWKHLGLWSSAIGLLEYFVAVRMLIGSDCKLLTNYRWTYCLPVSLENLRLLDLFFLILLCLFLARVFLYVKKLRFFLWAVLVGYVLTGIQYSIFFISHFVPDRLYLL